LISGVLLKCLLEIVWKSPGNLFVWICIHPEEGHPAFKNLFHSSLKILFWNEWRKKTELDLENGC